MLDMLGHLRQIDVKVGQPSSKGMPTRPLRSLSLDLVKTGNHKGGKENGSYLRYILPVPAACVSRFCENSFSPQRISCRGVCYPVGNGNCSALNVYRKLSANALQRVFQKLPNTCYNNK